MIMVSVYLTLASVNHSQAQDHIFPFVGEISSSEVNIRSGPSLNFETLSRLALNDEVVVVDRNFSWYKINMPRSAKCFIHSKFVQRGENSEGRITASRVNIRSGPGLIHTILGQGQKGVEIVIVDEHGEWLRIEPIEGIYGWVSEDLIKFKTADVSSHKNAIRAARIERERQKLERARQIAEVERQKQLEMLNFVKTQGRLEPVLRQEFSGAAYKLVIDNRTRYYLDGVDYILDDLLYYDVVVEGKKNPQDAQVRSHPLVKIHRLELLK